MKNVHRFVSAMLGIVALVTLQGRLKDSLRETYKIYTPVYKPLSQVRSEMRGGPAQPLEATGKLYVHGSYIFLNEPGKGIHVIDNSNAAAPTNLAFIPIPGNVDLAVKGAYLYADSYSDVAVFDISQPANVQPVKFLNNVIKDRNQYWYNATNNPDSIQVLVGYNERDTTVDFREYRRWQNCTSCLYASQSGPTPIFTSAPQVGVGGSMARFTIVNDYLYVVSLSDLYSINIAAAEDPQLVATANVGWNMETLYPFQDKLFIGSRQGMFVYSLANPASPSQLGQFSHVTSCDPVIADEQYAYVTLRSGTACNNATINQMDILDVSNVSSPSLVSTIRMTNPHGLAKDGNKLFVCDGNDGLKMYDATNRRSPTLQKHIPDLETFDVIALNGTALVVAKDGLYQYRYGSGETLSLLSKLSIQTTK